MRIICRWNATTRSKWPNYPFQQIERRICHFCSIFQYLMASEKVLKHKMKMFVVLKLKCIPAICCCHYILPSCFLVLKSKTHGFCFSINFDGYIFAKCKTRFATHKYRLYDIWIKQTNDQHRFNWSCLDRISKERWSKRNINVSSRSESRVLHCITLHCTIVTYQLRRCQYKLIYFVKIKNNMRLTATFDVSETHFLLAQSLSFPERIKTFNCKQF